MTAVESNAARVFRSVMFVAGPALAAATYAALPETFTRLDDSGATVTVTLDHAARAAAAAGVWMAAWWLSEAVHITVTALLPLVILPLFGVRSVADAASPYAHPIIFLFMGGFILSLSMQKWGLHRRIAMVTLRVVGTRPPRLVFGFMLATAVLSMWVSNTATTLMMLPIALSVLDRFGLRGGEDETGEGGSGATATATLGVCMALGIAYAASIGGLGSPLGSPPNAIALGYLNQRFGITISFAQWMAFSLPVVAVFLPIGWLVLTRWLQPVRNDAFAETAHRVVEEIHKPLGRMNRGEVVTAVVFALAVVAWVSRSLYQQVEVGSVRPFAGSAGDALIAMAASIALFVTPASVSRRRFIMDWQTASRLPWGVLILFGGGLSLAGALAEKPDDVLNAAGEVVTRYASCSGYIAEQLSALSALPLLLIVGATVTLVIFMTELTSNTATANTLVPILGALAVSLGVAPATLILPAALAATCAFMLPVATPPNAIVYGSGFVKMNQMVRAGFVLNLIGIVLITVILYYVLPMVLGDL